MSDGRRVVPLADANATEALGGALGRALQPGSVLLLVGDLGAGKTTLVRGLVAALPSSGTVMVRSPTYALCHPYSTTPRVWHVDLYRLAGQADVEMLGLTEAADQDDVLVVEWADKALPVWPDAVRVNLDTAGDGRTATVWATGPLSARVLQHCVWP